MKKQDNSYEIGKRRYGTDSIVKALGCADFLADIKLPQMLYGKILRSPLPHAQILNMDTSKAEQLPGVKAVITAKDTPGIRFRTYFDVPGNKLALENEKVRFVGDEIAAVAAIDEEIALEALDLIRVDYKELPAVYDPEEAMRPGAPQIHAEAANNISYYIKREFGSVEEGFKDSDYIFENRFETSAVSHGFLETVGCIAQFDLSSNLTVWLSTQNPFHLRRQLAYIANIPEARIKVKGLHIGGGFGGKTAMLPLEPICIFLARKSGKPVKIINTREEQLSTGRIRYPMTIELKTGVKKDGRLVARQARVITDNGAYDNKGASITTQGTCERFIQLYRVPNIQFEIHVVFTNKQWGDSFRGRGAPQGIFAIESQMDIIAEGLRMDPAELRLKNVNLPGEINPAGNRITSCALRECIEKVVAESGWKEKRGKRNNRGIGMACVIHTGGGAALYGRGNFSAALIRADQDGTFHLITGETDIGQGTNIMLSQIVAEVLRVPIERIKVAKADTDSMLPSLGTWGSRITYTAGNAVLAAARDLRQQLFWLASEMLGENIEKLDANEGKIFVRGQEGEKSVSVTETISEGIGKKGIPLMGKGYFEDKNVIPRDPRTGCGNPYPTWHFGCQAAEVEVDPETGKVAIVNLVAAHDLGRAINPMGAEGQIEGAVMQGTGCALFEELKWEKGRIVNPNFRDYKMPTFSDIFPIKTILVESEDPDGPFGAKGIGEAGIVPTTTAIVNAIYDAVGVRITSLPITPEKIFSALRRKACTQK